jgi:hypothetical protein
VVEYTSTYWGFLELTFFGFWGCANFKPLKSAEILLVRQWAMFPCLWLSCPQVVLWMNYCSMQKQETRGVARRFKAIAVHNALILHIQDVETESVGSLFGFVF